MHKYAAIKKERPNKSQHNVTIEMSQTSRDENEILKDAKSKLRTVLSNGSAPVFPYPSDSARKRYETVLLLDLLFRKVTKIDILKLWVLCGIKLHACS